MARARIDLSGLPGWPYMFDEATAAAFVGLSLADFRRAVRHCELPGSRQLAGRQLWARSEIEHWLAGGGPKTSIEADPILDVISKIGTKP